MPTMPIEKSSAIYVPVDGVTLTGIITTPEPVSAIVAFAHGVSSSRFSPANRYIANKLTDNGFATLLIDLLTPGERASSQQRDMQANVAILSSRLVRVIDWIKRNKSLRKLPLGVYGSNVSAIAALIAASERPTDIEALVLCNARPDLVKDYLPTIKAPALLIAGDKDRAQLQFNREILESMQSDHHIEIITGTTHDLRDPHILEQIAQQGRGWFSRHLTGKFRNND